MQIAGRPLIIPLGEAGSSFASGGQSYRRAPRRLARPRMFAPLVTVGAVTVLVKLAGAVKVVIIARYFGLGMRPTHS